jgi:hypothetical protein
MSKPANTQSPVDSAFARFRSLVMDKRLIKLDDGLLSESDTRSKYIDPIFKDILGWHEAEIRREKPVSKGFVDYVLGSEYSYLLIEAKRSKPRFQLSAPNKARRLKLAGPHLLENKKIKPFIEQAQSYTSDTGAQFCLVTNGPQFVVFRPFLPGRPWRQGSAIVYHDYRDIEQNFAEFFALLSRDQVIAGSLNEAFEHLERTTAQLYPALDFVSDPDRELVRNRFWQRIARTMGPLLTDQSEDPRAQLEIIRNCYVSTPLVDQADDSINALLKDSPKPFLRDAAVVDLKPGAKGKTAFSHRLEVDVHQARKGAYILTGGVGSGKTTFLRRFAKIVDQDFVERYTVWLHVDFLPIGNIDPVGRDQELRSFVYRTIRNRLDAEYGAELSASGQAVRALFEPEIREAEKTLLYGLAEGSHEATVAINQLVETLYRDDERFTFASLRYLRGRGRKVCVVLDNTDQLGEAFQESVFLLAQKLSADFEALCVVTLREEKFFAAYRRGIFDAFGDRRFHIGSPDLRAVLRKRLEYGRKKFAALQGSDSDELTPDERLRVTLLLKALINSTTAKNATIVRMLASVSNGDMRHALDMFRDFLSSGNTNVDKIIDIVERERFYTVPFHEFAKSAILGSRRYYRSSVSHIVNVFKQADARGSSHLTACRILARLAAAEGASSPHGEGFVAVTDLLREYRESFGFAEDFVQWTGELLRRNLAESEPPRVADVRQADGVRISAAGAYYWRYLVRSFAYIDLVYVDTPIADHTVARRLAAMADKSDLTVRFERVRAFLACLRHAETEELAVVAERVGPFAEAMVPQIRRQIESEIRIIAKKTGARDEFLDEQE